jgi:hypothetical protein
MVVRWGGVGQNGNGGHGHNDLSSYDLSFGVPFVVDSGSYLYTADPASRDAFRSAAAHNVALVDGLDMHPLPSGQPFRMPAHARFKVEYWREAEDEIALAGAHDGFRRSGSSIRLRRQITLDRTTGEVQVMDEAEGTGQHRVDSLLHLAPGSGATIETPNVVTVQLACRTVRVSFTGATSVSIEQGWVSFQYGVRERALVIRASVQAALPLTIGYRIMLV